MIIAWWHKDFPQCIEIIDEDILPWINANWIEKRPADEKEKEMYKKGIRFYKIKKNLKGKNDEKETLH